MFAQPPGEQNVPVNLKRHSATHSAGELERKLQSLRQRTLIATRQGDFHAVARLTNEVNRLSEQIASRHHAGGIHVSGR